MDPVRPPPPNQFPNSPSYPLSSLLCLQHHNCYRIVAGGDLWQRQQKLQGTKPHPYMGHLVELYWNI